MFKHDVKNTPDLEEFQKLQIKRPRNLFFFKPDVLLQLSLKVAREEHQKQEQQHLNDKQVLTNQLHDKDKQYQQLIRDTKATQSGKSQYQF